MHACMHASPLSAAVHDERAMSLPPSPVGEHCIDGKLFLKKFFHVKEVAVRKDNAHKQSNHAAKQKTLSLMRTVDHLPKILGR